MMKVTKVILIIVGVILTSFYLFPFEFVAIPDVNTKMAMAAVGLAVFVCQMAYKRTAMFDYKYILLGVLAATVSLFSLATMIYNNTRDNSYLGYIMTFLVWLGGAYCATRWIKYVHGKISVELVCNYLIAVCVIQCVLALMIDTLPPFKEWVNAHIGYFGGMGPAAGIDKYDRLYGIGAALDIAGGRFAVVLVIIAAMIRYNNKYMWLYIFSFFVIGILGNMIARTTTIGIIMAILFIVITYWNELWTTIANRMSFYFKLSLITLLLTVLVSYFYNTNPQFQANFRFGFEGFFSLFETGEWQSQSNDILINMYRFPNSLKTWLIGDGYMNNPMGDPYYIGYHWKGFYMGTDVGYLRFIYYFGFFGLFFMVTFMIYASKVCVSKFPSYKLMFTFVLLVNFIVWFKVSTDQLVFFTLFLSVLQSECEEKENPIPDTLDI